MFPSVLASIRQAPERPTTLEAKVLTSKTPATLKPKDQANASSTRGFDSGEGGGGRETPCDSGRKVSARVSLAVRAEVSDALPKLPQHVVHSPSVFNRFAALSSDDGDDDDTDNDEECDHERFESPNVITAMTVFEVDIESKPDQALARTLESTVDSWSDSAPESCGSESADRDCSAYSESLPVEACSPACDYCVCKVNQRDCVVPRFAELVLAAASTPRFGTHEAAAIESCDDSTDLLQCKCPCVRGPDELLFDLHVQVCRTVVSYIPECSPDARCKALHARRPRKKALKKRKKIHVKQHAVRQAEAPKAAKAPFEESAPEHVCTDCVCSECIGANCFAKGVAQAFANTLRSCVDSVSASVSSTSGLDSAVCNCGTCPELEFERVDEPELVFELVDEPELAAGFIIKHAETELVFELVFEPASDSVPNTSGSESAACAYGNLGREGHCSTRCVCKGGICTHDGAECVSAPEPEHEAAVDDPNCHAAFAMPPCAILCFYQYALLCFIYCSMRSQYDACSRLGAFCYAAAQFEVAKGQAEAPKAAKAPFEEYGLAHVCVWFDISDGDVPVHLSSEGDPAEVSWYSGECDVHESGFEELHRAVSDMQRAVCHCFGFGCDAVAVPVVAPCVVHAAVLQPFGHHDGCFCGVDAVAVPVVTPCVVH